MTEQRITTHEAIEALELHVLQVMAESYAPFGRYETFYHFAALAGFGMSREVTRAVVRGLTDKGLCQFQSGLWDEGGEPSGAGYGITPAGYDHYLNAVGKS